MFSFRTVIEEQTTPYFLELVHNNEGGREGKVVVMRIGVIASE